MKENWDVGSIVLWFLHQKLLEQEDTMRTLNNAFRQNKAIREFVAEICDSVSQQNVLPTMAIGIGLMYGMVTGIFLERERAGRKQHSYDISGVIAEFLTNKYPERRKMVQDFTGAFRDSDAVKLLVIQVGQVCMNNLCTPVQTVAMSLRYGMCIGIYCEKDRVARSKPLVH